MAVRQRRAHDGVWVLAVDRNGQPALWSAGLEPAVRSRAPLDRLLADLGVPLTGRAVMEAPAGLQAARRGWVLLADVAGENGQPLRLLVGMTEAPADTGVAAGPADALYSIIGESQAIRAARELAVRVARASAPVLILGETGVGKELFARAIHQLSPRANGPFVAVNCAAIPESLAEAELFGYERGAFTGAAPEGRPGRFERAHMGTLFLDEVGELSPALQARLLRVLQEGEVERLGGVRSIRVDVRIVSATNRDLRQMVAQGTFREDLYYRLNVLRLTIPPLRERREDIPLLVQHYVERFCQSYGLPRRVLTPQAMATLCEYPWPGNVRQLISSVQRLVLLVSQPVIERAHVLQVLDDMDYGRSEGLTAPEAAAATALAGGPLPESVASLEMRLIVQALEQARGNKKLAAQLLGINRSTLYEKLQRYGLLAERR